MFPTVPLFSRTATRRLRLTTKQAGPNYYKGVGTGSMGRHTKHGGYIIDWKKVRTYVVPSGLFPPSQQSSSTSPSSSLSGEDFEPFRLTPFVTRQVELEKGRFGQKNKEGGIKGHGPMSGELWYQNYKRSTGT